MGDLTGTVTLVRFVVRRDRIRLLVWAVAVTLLVALTAGSVKGLYPTQADLDVAATASNGNAAAIAFNGPAQGLDTLGGQVAFQIGTTGMVIVALMSLLLIGRLTRGEEESGRLELLRSLPVGSHAPTAAASLVVGALNFGVGVSVAITLVAMHLPAAGSIGIGASFFLIGLIFAGVALVAAQITENTRVVAGSAGALLGAAFVVRAIGDIGDSTLSWLSPIGWLQKTRPFAHEVWWPFLLTIPAIAALASATRRFAARRDIGGGLVQPRPGRRVASAHLGSALGLATRLQRGSVVGWSLGVAATGVAYGSIADSIDDFVRDNKALADLLSRSGSGSLTDSYLATSLRIVALIGTGCVIQSTLRLRGEETLLRAEPVLATPVSRRRWALSHLAVAFVASVMLMAVAGLAVGASYGIVGGDLGVVPTLLGAALAYVPAMWWMSGVTMVLIGWAPRAVAASWAVLAAAFVVALLGELLGLPRWVDNLSPFDHVPPLPAGQFVLAPVAILTASAVALTLVGLAGLRQRDIG